MHLVAYALLFLISLNLGCASPLRLPSSSAPEPSSLDYAQRTQYEIDKEIVLIDRLKHQREKELNRNNPGPTSMTLIESQLKKSQDRLNQLELNKNRYLKILSSQTKSTNSFLAKLSHLTQGLVEKKEKLVLNQDSIRFAQPIPLENEIYKKYSLEIETFLGTDNPNIETQVIVEMNCDSNFEWTEGIFFKTKQSASRKRFKLYNNHTNGQTLTLEFPTSVRICSLKGRYENEPDWSWTVELRSLSALNPALPSLMNGANYCELAPTNTINNLDSLFWSHTEPNMTCPTQVSKIYGLRDPINSLQKKLESLIGQAPTREELLKLNPLMPLDFSLAPQFDVIYLSSLNFSADFYGSMIRRALEHHAGRGTQIRIELPKVTLSNKDLTLLTQLTSRYPNVKLQLYKYSASDLPDGTPLDRWHRVNHSKLIIGISTQDPTKDFLITGGRNIRDSYIFTQPTNLKLWPWLVNYPDGEEPYVFYDDYEILIKDTAAVKSVYSQAQGFFMRDHEYLYRNSTSINSAHDPTTLPNRDLDFVRHFYSVPFKKSKDLEHLFVNLIDQSKTEILMTTPYFRPTPQISEALGRASQRGVKIHILTRIELAGDGTPKIAEDVNKKGVNEHLHLLNLYEWTENNSIMHAKLATFDREIALVSSVNLNKRSFTHDIESGFLIRGNRSVTQITEEIEAYLKKSKPIQETKKINFFNRVLLDFLDPFF